jgi:transposase
MAFKRITEMDLYDIITRWHSGYTISQLSALSGLDRKTVRQYIGRAEQAGLSRAKPLPEREELLELFTSVVPKREFSQPARDTFAPFRQEIISLVTAAVDPVKAKTAFEILCERHGLTASYSSFKRFIRTLPELRAPKNTTCALVTDPGEEIQIDYAKMGRLVDPATGKNRDLYAFIAIASHSRLKFVHFVYKQDQRSFVASNIRMFEFYDGVPQRLVIDNLKAGVIRPDLYDPRLNRTFGEMAEHYGVFIDPARPAHPKDKAKVERTVQSVREQFRKFKALHPQLDIHRANRRIREWCLQSDGLRIHSTTGLKPLEAFEQFEKPRLKALPANHFEIATWKAVRVHVDQYIQFERGFYSVPEPYVGKELWVRATTKLVEIYDDFTRIKTHVRTNAKRHTDPGDFPENFQVMMGDTHVRWLIAQAAKVGGAFKQLIVDVLTPHAKRNTRKAQAFIKLAEHYPAEQLNAAAQIACQHKYHLPKQLEALIGKMFNEKNEADVTVSEATQAFIRPADYFIKN